MAIGILAFGSLRNNPGRELDPLIIRRDPSETPFCVEFARSSQKRGGAPTLVPVEAGLRLPAEILVLSEGVDKPTVVNMLYRREIQQVGTTKRYPSPPRTVVIKTCRPDAVSQDIHEVLFASNERNIPVEDLTPQHLAHLAIDSVHLADPGMDGIAYLIDAKHCSARTSLSQDYERAILARVGVESLEQALAALMTKRS